MSEGNGKKLPQGWALARIGDVMDLINGRAFKPAEWVEAGTPIIRIQNLNDEEAAFNYFVGELPAKFRVGTGDLLFAWSGTPGTSFGAHIWKRGTAWLNQHIFKVEFCPHTFDTRFLRDAINQNLTEYIRQAHGGAGLAHITKGRFEESELRIAPLAEQVRIADKLDELLSDLDAGVKALDGVRAKLKQYRAAVLKAAVDGTLTSAWRAQHPDVEPADQLLDRILLERCRRWEEALLKKFADAGKAPPKGWKEKYQAPTAPELDGLPTLPTTWRWASVDQIADVQGGLQKSPSRAPIAHHFPYLRVANVLRGSLDLRNVSRFELTDDELDRLRLFPGDLLIVEGNGSRTEIGRTAVWRGEIENCVHQNHIIRVRPGAGIVASFAGQYFNSPTGQLAIQLVASSTSGLYTLSIGKIERLAIAIPPTDEQEAVVEAVESQLSVIDHLESDLDAKLKSATALRQSILKSAFEGKLVPQDPTDEPARELLKRIAAQRAERERLAKEAKTAAKKVTKTAKVGAPRRGRKAKAANTGEVHGLLNNR